MGPWTGYSSISAAIAVNTTISAAAATVSTLFVSMLHQYLSLGVVVWDLIIAGGGARRWMPGRTPYERLLWRAGMSCRMHPPVPPSHVHI